MSTDEQSNAANADASGNPAVTASSTSQPQSRPGDASATQGPASAVPPPATTTPGTEPPPTNVPLTYQNFLRAIGRHLDRGRYRYTLICQIPSGFVIRGYASGFENVRSAEALVFTYEDLTAMINDLFVSRSPLPANEIPDPSEVPRLLPTGYEDFLRALGHECDTGGVSNVRLVETLEGVVLSYDQEGSKSRQERSFNEQQIYAMLNTAFNRRGPRLKQPPPPAASAPPSPPPDASQPPGAPPSSPLRRVGIKQ